MKVTESKLKQSAGLGEIRSAFGIKRGLEFCFHQISPLPSYHSGAISAFLKTLALESRMTPNAGFPISEEKVTLHSGCKLMRPPAAEGSEITCNEIQNSLFSAYFNIAALLNSKKILAVFLGFPSIVSSYVHNKLPSDCVTVATQHSECVRTLQMVPYASVPL